MSDDLTMHPIHKDFERSNGDGSLFLPKKAPTWGISWKERGALYFRGSCEIIARGPGFIHFRDSQGYEIIVSGDYWAEQKADICPTSPTTPA